MGMIEIVAAVVIAALVIALLRSRLAVLAQPPAPPPEVAGPAPAGPLPYRKRDYLLSSAERAFYDALVPAAGPDLVVFAKVRLDDLFWLPNNTAARQSWRNRIAAKHVDFVLCSRPTLTPVLAIELDDASHAQDARQARDAFVDRVYATAGLPVLHQPVRAGYAVDALRGTLRAALTGPPGAA